MSERPKNTHDSQPINFSPKGTALDRPHGKAAGNSQTLPNGHNSINEFPEDFEDEDGKFVADKSIDVQNLDPASMQ